MEIDSVDAGAIKDIYSDQKHPGDLIAEEMQKVANGFRIGHASVKNCDLNLTLWNDCIPAIDANGFKGDLMISISLSEWIDHSVDSIFEENTGKSFATALRLLADKVDAIGGRS